MGRFHFGNLHRAIVYKHDAIGTDIPSFQDAGHRAGFGFPVDLEGEDFVTGDDEIFPGKRLAGQVG